MAEIKIIKVGLDSSPIGPSGWASTPTVHPDERTATPTLARLYDELEEAINCVAGTAATAQAVLPTDLVRHVERALAELLLLKGIVDPGPSDEEPF